MDTFLNVTLIAAHDRNRAIGRDNDLPWPRMPKDMAHFQFNTQHHPVIMGRKTWDSIPEAFRPFTDRTNIVLSTSHEPGVDEQGVIWCRTPLEALTAAAQAPGNEEIYIIGGAAIYLAFAPAANRQVLTVLDLEAENPDTFYPEVPGEWDTFEEPYFDKKTEVTGTIKWMMRTDTRQPVVEPQAARGVLKQAEYRAINSLGVCPFCYPNGFTWLDPNQKPLKEGVNWGVFRNYNPYQNAATHLMFILKRHVLCTEELTPEEVLELHELKCEMIRSLNITASAYIERQGTNPLAVGQSVHHLHTQLIVPVDGMRVEAWFGPPDAPSPKQ